MNDPGNRHAGYRGERVTLLGLCGLLIAGALGAVGLMAAARASTRPAAAVTQQGTPPASGLPGFTRVVTTSTVCPAGATLGPLRIDGVQTTLTVPPGAFPECVKIIIASGDMSLLTKAVFSGYHIVTAAGVHVLLNGTPFPGTFLEPLTLTWRSPVLTAGTAVTVWNGASLTVDPAETASAGGESVTFDGDPDFVFVSPNSVSPTVPGATVPVTGNPLLGEGILAGSLVVAGLGGFGMSRRRKVRD